MKKLLVIFVISFIFLLSSCEEEIIPIASFETEKLFLSDFPNYATFEQIKFINTSSSDHIYDWDFGNGQVSNEPMPIIAYNTAGEYNVTLTVKSETGNQSTFTRQIKIFERVVRQINIEVKWGYDALYSMEEVGWKEGEISNFIFVIGIGDLSPFSGAIDEVVYVSDTLKNIQFLDPSVTIFPKEKILINPDFISPKDLGKTYKLQLYTVHGDLSQLYFSNNGLSFWYYNKNEQFVLGSIGSTITITCDYE